MGSTYIEGFRGMVSEEERLRIHLSANHFPPVHPDFIPSAQEAIQLVTEHKSQQPITMPNGVTKTAGEIVEGLHLHSFLPTEL